MLNLSDNHNFTIEFTEWVRLNFYDTGSKWHREPNEDYTTEELLKIYIDENKNNIATT
mgnify:CR=1 FL=1